MEHAGFQIQSLTDEEIDRDGYWSNSLRTAGYLRAGEATIQTGRLKLRDGGRGGRRDPAVLEATDLTPLTLMIDAI